MKSFQDTIKSHKMIIRSGRKFDEIMLSLWDYDNQNVTMLEKIFQAQHESIKKLSITFGTISHSALSYLLCSLPSLEEIALDVNMLEDLSKLKSLKSLVNVKRFTCNIQAVKIISELAENTLTELTFASSIRSDPPSAQLLWSILTSQRNLKVLNFNASNLKAGMLEGLSLNEVRLVGCDDLCKVLSSQKSLMKLSAVDKESITLEEFRTVCDLRDLQSLQIDIRSLDKVALCNLEKLENLKFLLVKMEKSSQFLFSEEMKLESVTQLEIVFLHLDSHFTNSLRCTFPNVNHVKVSKLLLSDLPVILTLENLKHLEVKCIQSDSVELSSEEIFNNLESFSVEQTIGVKLCQLLPLITKQMPILMSLKVKSAIFQLSAVLQTLKMCGNLEFLAVDAFNVSILNENIFDCIRNHKKIKRFEYRPVQMEESKMRESLKKFDILSSFATHKLTEKILTIKK